MSAQAPVPAALSAADAAPPLAGWTLATVGVVDSTNRLAASLPAWSAVRAETQTAGRGRTGRVWTSDLGGLWLSAVLPCPGPRDRWARLPLAVGWALADSLRSFGVRDLRVRWPNDLLVGDRKLAGILLERHSADTAVVGLGLNIFNDPASACPALCGATTRLADLAPLGGRSLDDFAGLALAAISRAHRTLRENGFPRIAADLNQTWGAPRRVALTLPGHAAHAVGFFTGMDDHGRLRLRDDSGAESLHDSVQVALLTEL